MLTGCSQVPSEDIKYVDIHTKSIVGVVEADSVIKVTAPNSTVHAGKWIDLPMLGANMEYDVISVNLASIGEAEPQERSTLLSIDETLKDKTIWIIRVDVRKSIGVASFELSDVFSPANSSGDKVQEIVYEKWAGCNKNATITDETEPITVCYMAVTGSGEEAPSGVIFTGSQLSDGKLNYNYSNGKPVLFKIH